MNIFSLFFPPEWPRRPVGSGAAWSGPQLRLLRLERSAASGRAAREDPQRDPEGAEDKGRSREPAPGHHRQEERASGERVRAERGGVLGCDGVFRHQSFSFQRFWCSNLSLQLFEAPFMRKEDGSNSSDSFMLVCLGSLTLSFRVIKRTFWSTWWLQNEPSSSHSPLRASNHDFTLVFYIEI